MVWRDIMVDAEKFAEWVLAHEREIETIARAGDKWLDPICLFVSSQIHSYERPARYLIEQGVFKCAGGREIDAPGWVDNYIAALSWWAGRGKGVNVDTVLKAIEHALYLECVKTNVKKRVWHSEQ
jgi:hypothetical protein